MSAATPGPLGGPPARTLVGVCEQEHLHLGVRGDDRSDVATLDHGVATHRERALTVAHDLAHLRDDARPSGNEPVDLRVADRSRHVLAVHLDAAVTPERDRVRERELGERRPVREIRSVAPCDPGQRPVHRARVEVAEAEPARERRRDGALPGAGRAVDGHDHVAGG